MPEISVIIPALNEAENLVVLVTRLSKVLANHDFEIIFVDDGSTDSTREVLATMAASDSRLRFIALTRNFGHQVALRAGLDHAAGHCVITLDADLQHPPEMLPEMIEKWRAGYAVVNMIRCDDSLPFRKRASSRLYYRVLNSLSDLKVEPGSADFRLLDRRVVDVLKEMGERTLFLRGLIPWLGFRQCSLHYEPDPRYAGSRKYDLRRMLMLALSGVTSSSARPLHLATLLGATMSLLATVFAVYALSVKLFLGTAVSGWTSLILSVMLLGGVQLLMLGILGEYVGRVLVEVKRRPLYVVHSHNLPGVVSKRDVATGSR